MYPCLTATDNIQFTDLHNKLFSFHILEGNMCQSKIIDTSTFVSLFTTFMSSDPTHPSLKLAYMHS